MAEKTTTPDETPDTASAPDAEASTANAPATEAPVEAPEPIAATAAPVSAAVAPAAPGMSRLDRNLAVITAVIAAVLVLGRIGSFGIWDPWELTAADLARNIADGELVEQTTAPLSAWLVARGFALFGIHEWSGRLPIALAGLAALFVVAYGTRRSAGHRAGLFAALIVASTPIFLLNSRGMMGAAPGFLASAMVFFFALELATVDSDESRTKGAARQTRMIAGVGLLLSIGLATLASGALLGVAPPLCGVGAALLARGDVGPLPKRVGPRAQAAIAVVVVAIVAALGVTRAVLADVEGYSAWLGGAPRGTSPGTFEVVIEQVFHGFAPWTAMLPVGFGWIAFREDDATRPRRESLLGLGAVAWAAFAFAAVSIFDARYGTAPFPAPIALGVIAALGLEESHKRGGSWAAGLVTALLALLILRDFRGYPVTPTGGLALTAITAPEAFNPWLGWAATLAPFALVAFLGLARDPTDAMVTEREDAESALRAGRAGLVASQRTLTRKILAFLMVGLYWFGVPHRAIKSAYARGGAFLGWLSFFATVAFAVLAYGIICWVLPDDSRPQAIIPAILVPLGLVGLVAWFFLRFRSPAMLDGNAWARIGLPVLAMSLLGAGIATGVLSIEGLSSLAIRVGRYLLPVPFGVIFAVAGFRALRFGFHALGDWATVPVVLMGVIVGGYTSLRWQPELSQHFSPREVYDTYNGLSADGEPLGEYHVSGRAAAYYTDGEIVELESEPAALEFLEREGRAWLAFRADDLASLDRAYRTRSGRHLFIADARSSNVLLATNQPISGRADENYLANAILDAPPATIEFPVNANFDRRIELLGYDIEAPRGDRMGPGDLIVVTWYWLCTAPVPGSYQVFLHVDGMGQRLNGDHEPVEGRYPVRLWSAGDIIVDRQELRIPGNFPPGSYSFNIGFYSGESRLEVVEGPEDDANRAIAGTIVVR